MGERASWGDAALLVGLSIMIAALTGFVAHKAWYAKTFSVEGFALAVGGLGGLALLTLVCGGVVLWKIITDPDGGAPSVSI